MGRPDKYMLWNRDRKKEKKRGKRGIPEKRRVGPLLPAGPRLKSLESRPPR
jgi:hypothetical protein